MVARKRVSVAHITRYLLVPGILIFGSVLPGKLKCFCYIAVRRCPRLFFPPLPLFPSPPLSLSPLWKLNVNKNFTSAISRGLTSKEESTWGHETPTGTIFLARTLWTKFFSRWHDYYCVERANAFLRSSARIKRISAYFGSHLPWCIQVGIIRTGV